MKKLFKKIFYLLFVLSFLNACQSVKDGLTGKKRSNSDEFLIEKKNPLVLPPEYSELPKPKTLIQNKEIKQEEINLESILTGKTSTNKTTSTSEISSGPLEESILDKIKKN
tara:strand:+ start:173 stop:505 length:333 start_codon:yes stop_codon:yes gene_type:complete